jgi:hypothetical protein
MLVQGSTKSTEILDPGARCSPSDYLYYRRGLNCVSFHICDECFYIYFFIIFKDIVEKYTWILSCQTAATCHSRNTFVVCLGRGNLLSEKGETLLSCYGACNSSHSVLFDVKCLQIFRSTMSKSSSNSTISQDSSGKHELTVALLGKLTVVHQGQSNQRRKCTAGLGTTAPVRFWRIGRSTANF